MSESTENKDSKKPAPGTTEEIIRGRPARVQGLSKRRWLITYTDGQIPRPVVWTDARLRKERQP